MSSDWKTWQGPSTPWLREGYYISYIIGNVRFYEWIYQRDLAHWEYAWPETISATDVSGPVTPDKLEITKGYDTRRKINRFWQIIFGIKGQAYIYVELPGDTHRHGIPKEPKPTTDKRETSHFEEYISPFMEPTFLTEHFMMRLAGTERITLSAYNPNSIDLTNVRLNFFIAKISTERVGNVEAGVLEPAHSRWKDTLEKLWKGMIPQRPITLMPVRAPAEAVSGE